MSPKVTKLSDYNDNCLSVSPEQAIQSLQEFMKENPEFDKVFLIAASTKSQDFFYTWFKEKMLISEAIAALQLALSDQINVLS